jgi:Beta-propeller repeat/RTX calcium-binding nonapeptide repeat (4 copies)
VAEQLNTFQQVYTPGSDISAASEVGQLIWGRTGNDLLLGFQKVNPGSNPSQIDYLLGDVAIDDPQGRQWGDTFILGDWQKPYYANAPFSLYGLNEYAVVTDFNPQLDRVQLFGNANNYRTLNVGTGTLLLLQKPTGLDVVAFFLGTPSLNLNAAYFQYKGNTATPGVAPKIKQVGTAGTDILASSRADAAGNVYIAGGTNGSIVGGTSNNESRDAALIKYDAQGNVLWQKQFGTNRYETIYDVKTDAAGNVFTLGVTFGNLAAQKAGDVSDVFLRKYTSAGQEVWTKQFGDTAPATLINSAFSLDLDATGNIYVAGLSARNNQGSLLPVDNFWVTRFDTNGNRQWYTEFGTPDFDEPYGIAVSNDGSVYAAGWSFGNFGGAGSAQGSYDGAIAKLNSQGQVQWQRNLGTSDYEWIWGVDTDSQNNVYVSGWTLGTLPGNTNAGAADAFLAKYDKDGNRLWVKQFGTDGDDQAFRMTIDARDNIFITGYTDKNLGGTNAGSTDAWVARFDTSGNRQWIRQFGTAEAEQGNGISVDNLGNVYVSGVTQGSLGAINAGSFDSWLAKFDIGGTLVSFGTPAAATSTTSTYSVGNTGGNPNVTDPLATTILQTVFGNFLVQQGMPASSGGATGANVEDLLRYPIAVPGIPEGMLTTDTSSLSFNVLNTLTSLLSGLSGRRTQSTTQQKQLSNTDNVFQGGNANQSISGQGGNDKLAGLGGTDILRGGSGNDRLIGGKGQDKLVGGGGADTFVLGSNSTDRIADFNFAEGDRIALPTSLSFEKIRIVQGTGINADNTLIQRGEDVLAIVLGVQANQLTQTAFT